MEERRGRLAAFYAESEARWTAEVQTDEQWMAHARATGSTTYHPVGTCKLGTDPRAVVDPLSMRVLGLQGLRVADASCMPTMVSGNTYAATNVIAEKGADLIAQT